MNNQFFYLTRLFLIYLCLIGRLNANDEDAEIDLNSIRSPLLVSLGSHCEVAAWMRAHQIRQTAFPFDWLLTLDHDHFIKILNDDFQHFLDPQYLILHPEEPTWIENTFYEVEFRHDWPYEDWTFNEAGHALQTIQMNVKYPRRIERFRSIRNYRGKVIFFRSSFDFANDPNVYWGKPDQSIVTHEQALSLKTILDLYFFNVDFVLVIVNYTDESLPPINGIDGVQEFRIRKTHKQEDYQTMFTIFNQP